MRLLPVGEWEGQFRSGEGSAGASVISNNFAIICVPAPGALGASRGTGRTFCYY